MLDNPQAHCYKGQAVQFGWPPHYYNTGRVWRLFVKSVPGTHVAAWRAHKFITSLS